MIQNRRKPNFFKRKYIINREIQFRFLSHFFMVSFVSSMMVFSLGIFLFLRFNYIGEKLNIESGHIFYNFLNEQFLTFIIGVFGIFALSCLSMTGIVIFFSHKIVGPLFRLSKELKRISNLKTMEELDSFTGIKFRKDDLCHDLAAEYNESISNLKRLSSIPESESKSKKIMNLKH